MREHCFVTDDDFYVVMSSTVILASYAFVFKYNLFDCLNVISINVKIFFYYFLIVIITLSITVITQYIDIMCFSKNPRISEE